jgi:hypothetical protein
MLKGIQIIRIGLLITAVSLILTHTVDFPHEFTSFFMGMGCSLALVGAGKRFVEMRTN